MFCSKCGKELEESFNCCPYCGNKLHNDIKEEIKLENKNIEDNDSGWWAVLGFFVPIVGLILFLVWEKEKPLTAKKCGKGALINVIVGVSISIVTFLIMTILFLLQIFVFNNGMCILF